MAKKTHFSTEPDPLSDLILALVRIERSILKDLPSDCEEEAKEAAKAVALARHHLILAQGKV
jgi:hypothetical protein